MTFGRLCPIGRRQLAAVVAVALLASLPASACAGAWTQSAGHVYARASYAYLNSRVRFDEHGERVGLEVRGSRSGEPNTPCASSASMENTVRRVE